MCVGLDHFVVCNHVFLDTGSISHRRLGWAACIHEKRLNILGILIVLYLIINFQLDHPFAVCAVGQENCGATAKWCDSISPLSGIDS